MTILNFQKERKKLEMHEQSLYSNLDTSTPIESHANIKRVNFAKEKTSNKPQKYPLINWNEADNIWKIPILYGISELMGYATDAVKGHHGFVEEIYKASIGMIGGFSKQLYRTYFVNSMPGIAALKGFADGQSSINQLPTIQIGKYELPFLNSEAGNFADAIKKNFEIINGRLVAKCNNMDRYVRNTWLMYSANPSTRGDYADLIDASKAKSWFAKDDTFNISQQGPELSSTTVNGFNVRVYGRPSKVVTFVQNLIASGIYNTLDRPFDVLDMIGLKKLPPGAIQQLKDGEYKLMAGVNRVIFNNHSRNYFTYDLPISYVKKYAPQIIDIIVGPSQMAMAA